MPAPKDSFGHYTIISQLGAGGMGEVYLAKDNKLGRRVALKLLPEQFAGDPERVGRFVREARAASALNHPNIITIHEVGEERGVNYIATEFIDGKTLRERFGERPLSFEEALAVAVQTAEALSAAHAAGIVHRDIKPENIMIRPDGYVKVLDFGIAKLTEDAEAASVAAETQKLLTTETGIIVGTAKYISPEQAYGKPVDSRSDVFSFGVVLYEMIAGRRPFEGETPLDAIAAIVYQEPPALKELVPELPHELERIISKCLRKNRDERYQRTAELLADLKYVRDQVARDPKLSTAVAGNATSVIVPPAATPTPTGGQRDAVLLADIENLTGEAVFDATLKTALTFSLAQSPYMNILPDAKVRETLRLMGREPDERIDKKLAREICVRLGSKAYIAGSIATMGSIYVISLEAVNSRSGDRIGSQLEQAGSKEEVLKALGTAATGLRQVLGESLSSIERFDAALENTTSSIEALKIYTIARGHALKGRMLEAIPFYKRAIDVDPDFEGALTGLALAYFNLGQRKQAAEYISRSYALRDRLSEGERLGVNYFYHLIVTGKLEEQIAALELQIATYPRNSVAHNNLADCYERIGNFDKAVAVAHRSLQIDRGVAIAHATLAESLLLAGRIAEAEDACVEALAKDCDSDFLRGVMFKLAAIRGERSVMDEQLAWFSGRSDEYIAVGLQAGAAGLGGQWRRSKALSRRAIELAEGIGATEVAAQFAAEQALRIVFWSSAAGLPEPGDKALQTAVGALVKKALKLERGQAILAWSGLALAVAGLAAEAAELEMELRRDHPANSLVSGLWRPVIRAALKLGGGKAKLAIEELETAERFEKAAAFYPQYLRGHAFMKLGLTAKAAAEFEKIIAGRGQAPLSSLYPLACLARARATGDAEDRQRFRELWSDADHDMPALIAAKADATRG